MTILKKTLIGLAVLIIALALLAAFLFRGDPAEYSLEEVTGLEPILAAPDPQTIPTVAIADPIGWEEGQAPLPAEGLEVNRFAEGLDHPRVMHRLPNGDIIVVLTAQPPAGEGGGLMGAVVEYFLEKAGSLVPSANQLVLLRDADGDGVAELREILQDDLDSPSGVGYHDGKLYVANHDEVLEFKYELGSLRVQGDAIKLMDLPPAGNHWMRNLTIHPDGGKLYVAVGSASNIGEFGMEAEAGRAKIHELDLETGRSRPFADGLRNANGLDWNPWTGELWTTVNERDQLGSDLVPDYLTNVPVGVQYGWPWLYWGEEVDERVEARMPQFLIEYTRTPEYALGPHVAALGLGFTSKGNRMGTEFGQGAFIAQHGSWNRKPPSGYDVVYVAFDERGNPLGKPVPILTGFLNEDGTTKGRPTWVAWDNSGALLVSDDTGGIIWRVVAPDAEPGPEPQRNRGEALPPRSELQGDPRVSALRQRAD